MAELSLKVKANLSDAVTQFKSLANVEENLTQKQKKLIDSFKTKEVDAFIQKQKLLGVAVTATKGEVAGLEAQYAAYQRKIEQLIKSGMDPEEESINRLQQEYSGLAEKIEKTKDKKSSFGDTLGSIKGQISSAIPMIGGLAAGYQALSNAVAFAKQIMIEGAEAYRQSEVASARLGAVLQATGAHAWTTSKQLGDFANELSSTTGKTVDEIKDMQSVLLGFTSVTGDVFKQANKNLIDMAAVMGGDLKSAANTFGKALDTPAESLSSLTRCGFKFTEQQKEEVKALESAGKHAEAQGIILQAMEGAFEGAAGAVNKAAKSHNDYNTALADFKKAAGESFEKSAEPIRNFFTEIIKHAADTIAKINETNKAIDNLRRAAEGELIYTEDTEGKIKKVTDNITALEEELKIVKAEANGAALQISDLGRGIIIDIESYEGPVQPIKEYQKLRDEIEAARASLKSLEGQQAEEQKAAEQQIQTELALAKAEEQKADWMKEINQIQYEFNRIKATTNDMVNDGIMTEEARKQAMLSANESATTSYEDLAFKFQELRKETEEGSEAYNTLSEVIGTVSDRINNTHNQPIKDLRKELKKIAANTKLEEQTRGYASALQEVEKELEISAGDMKNREAEMLRFHHERTVAEIEASKADNAHKKAAIDAEDKLYEAKRRTIQLIENNKVITLEQEYLSKIEEIAIQLAHNGKAESQLIELRYNRQRAAIAASNAEEEEKNKALAAYDALYAKEKELREAQAVWAANKKVEEQEKGYAASLVETNVRLKNYFMQEENLRILQRERAEAAITNSEAEDQAKQKALKQLQDLHAAEDILLAKEKQIKEIRDAIDKDTSKGQAKIAFLRKQQQEVMSLEKLTLEERLYLHKEIEEKITQILEDEEKKRKEIRQQSLQSTANLLGGIQDLITVFADIEKRNAEQRAEERIAQIQNEYDREYQAQQEAWEKRNREEYLTREEQYYGEKELKQRLVDLEKNKNDRIIAEQEKAKRAARAAAIANKVLSAAQAGINTAVGITRALAEVPFPLNWVEVGAIGAAGLAQQIAIATSPIPSAETGGRFVVPDVSGVGRTDGTTMRVNPGEVVDVTPRSMTGTGEVTHITINIDRQPVYDIVNEGIRSHNIVFDMDRNL